MCVRAHVRRVSHFSHVRLFATLWTVACQAPLSMRFSRREYWSGLSCPPPGYLPDPGDLPDPRIEPTSPVAPALPVNSLLLSHQGSPNEQVVVFQREVMVLRHCFIMNKEILGQGMSENHFWGKMVAYSWSWVRR